MTASDTYRNILATARRLFAKQGYTATSMRQVAAEAGIGKATIYHHFHDKRAIVMSLLQDNIAAMDKAVSIVRAENDPRRCIEVAVNVSISFLYDTVDIMQVVRREVPGGRDQMQTGFLSFYNQFVVLIEDALRRGIEAGIYRQVEVSEAARILMTMIQGTFAMAYLGNGRRSTDETARSLLDIYFQGIDLR